MDMKNAEIKVSVNLMDIEKTRLLIVELTELERQLVSIGATDQASLLNHAMMRFLQAPSKPTDGEGE